MIDWRSRRRSHTRPHRNDANPSTGLAFASRDATFFAPMAPIASDQGFQILPDRVAMEIGTTARQPAWPITAVHQTDEPARAHTGATAPCATPCHAAPHGA